MRDAVATLSPEIKAAVSTSGDKSTPVTAERLEDNWRERWNECIDSTLIEWGRNPDQFADPDEGFRAPTTMCIQAAIRVALRLRDLKEPPPPPSRVVPDGEGGLVFERIAGDTHESLRVYADCAGELLTFKHCELKSRLILRLT
ncbi:MAG: hypothetical protein HY287_16555 [Planctomycetes bacterium]|nr:hypothetical protein [Planctomycetota bacterium]MBI3835938.1 hypothetical protein [Planctomycetota bacterium]